MASLTKKQQNIRKKIVPNQLYKITDAIEILKEFTSSKFREGFDIAVNLGIDPKKSDQVVRASTNLPKGTGKSSEWLYLHRVTMLRKRNQRALILSGSKIWLRKLKPVLLILMWLLQHRMRCVSSVN